MKKINCPACNQPTIPVWKKLFLGPATNTRCNHCQAILSVSLFRSIIVLLPIILVAAYTSEKVTTYFLGTTVPVTPNGNFSWQVLFTYGGGIAFISVFLYLLLHRLVPLAERK